MNIASPSQEDWNWFDELPDELKQRVLRLTNSNNPSAIYHYGYSRGWRAAYKKFKKLVVITEHGEKDGASIKETTSISISK